MASVEFQNLWPFESQKQLELPCAKCSHCQENQLTCLEGNIFCPKCKSTSEMNYGSEIFIGENSCCKEEKRNIVAHCFTCCMDLCHVCFLEHQYMKLFEDHSVLNLSNQYQAENAAVQLTCCLHKNESLRYFCRSCSTLICEECTRNDHPKEEHDYDYVEQDLKIKIKEEIIRKGEAKMSELKNMGKLVEDQCCHLQEQYHKVQAEIKDVFCFFYNVIEDRKEQLLKELEHLYNRRMLPLRLIHNQISEVLQTVHLPSSVDLGQSIVVSDAAKLKSFLEITHSNDLSESVRKIAAQSTDLEFLSNYQAIKVGVHDMFGFINHKSEVSGAVKPLGRIKFEPKTKPSVCEATNNFGLSFDVTNSCKKISGRSLDAVHTSSKSFYSQSASTSEPEPKTFFPIGNIPKFYLKREKMIYYNKIGEFGILEGQFAEPSGVAVNSRNEILVADTNNHRIQVFDEDGRYKFKFGEIGNSQGQFFFPNRVAVSPKSGDIIITERNPTHQVQVYNQYGQFVRKFGADVLQHPRGVIVDNEDRIIVVECKVMKVVIFNILGNVLKKFGCSKYVEFPNGVAVNDKQEIFVSDNRAHCVKVFNYEGAYLRQIGGEGLTNYPISVCINKSGEILIADNHSSFNITIFTQDGQLIKGFESKAKHVQCFDTAVLDHDSIVLASKDFRLYLYRYNV